MCGACRSCLSGSWRARSSLVCARRCCAIRRSGSPARGLGLHGQGGIGKTVLACALARDDMVRRHFPDGVFWVTVGERPDLVALQGGLLAGWRQDAPGLRSVAEGVRLLRGGGG